MILGPFCQNLRRWRCPHFIDEFFSLIIIMIGKVTITFHVELTRCIKIKGLAIGLHHRYILWTQKIMPRTKRDYWRNIFGETQWSENFRFFNGAYQLELWKHWVSVARFDSVRLCGSLTEAVHKYRIVEEFRQEIKSAFLWALIDNSQPKTRRHDQKWKRKIQLVKMILH